MLQTVPLRVLMCNHHCELWVDPLPRIILLPLWQVLCLSRRTLTLWCYLQKSKRYLDNTQENIWSSLWLKNPALGHRVQTQNIIKQTSKAEESWVIQKECTERHEVARHTVSTALTQEESSFLYTARKGFVFTWLLLGSKGYLTRGVNFVLVLFQKLSF